MSKLVSPWDGMTPHEIDTQARYLTEKACAEYVQRRAFEAWWDGRSNVADELKRVAITFFNGAQCHQEHLDKLEARKVKKA